MDPEYVRRRLDVRADDVHRSLLLDHGQVPDRTRTIELRDYDFPDTPDDIFPWAAVALVTDPDHERILLLGHGEHDYAWEPPGGKGEPGEDPATTARREVYEETRVDPEITDLLMVERLEFDYGASVTAPVVQAVFAGEATGIPTVPDSEPGINEARWFAREDLPEAAQFRELILEELL